MFTRTVKILYAKCICVCLSKILSVKNFQRTIKNFQRRSKNQKNARRTKFFTPRVNKALQVLHLRQNSLSAQSQSLLASFNLLIRQVLSIISKVFISGVRCFYSRVQKNISRRRMNSRVILYSWFCITYGGQIFKFATLKANCSEFTLTFIYFQKLRLMRNRKPDIKIRFQYPENPLIPPYIRNISDWLLNYDVIGLFLPFALNKNFIMNLLRSVYLHKITQCKTLFYVL